GGAASVTIAEDSTVGSEGVAGDVTLSADTSVALNNAGRIKGDVTLISARTELVQQAEADTTSSDVDAVTLVETFITDETTELSIATVGGTADFVNSGTIGDPFITA